MWHAIETVGIWFVLFVFLGGGPLLAWLLGY